MIVLLNLILPAMLILGGWIAWKRKSVWPLVFALWLAVMYAYFQPSYMPKGEVVRSPVPALEQSEAPIENRLLAPKSGEEYDKEREAKIEEGLPFETKEEK